MQEVNYFVSFCPTFRSEKDSPTYHVKLHSSPTVPFLTRPVRRLEPQSHVEEWGCLCGNPTDLSQLYQFGTLGVMHDRTPDSSMT